VGGYTLNEAKAIVGDADVFIVKGGMVQIQLINIIFVLMMEIIN